MAARVLLFIRLGVGCITDDSTSSTAVVINRLVLEYQGRQRAMDCCCSSLFLVRALYFF